MRKTLAAIFVTLTLSVMSTAAHALPAFLVTCEIQTSTYTGMAVFVGVYSYQGDELTRVFPISAGYCPIRIEVY